MNQKELNAKDELRSRIDTLATEEACYLEDAERAETAAMRNRATAAHRRQLREQFVDILRAAESVDA